MIRAYILSTAHGTVQIGDTVYQPITGASFKTDRKGLAKKPFVNVKNKSMQSAKTALKKYYDRKGYTIP